MAEVALQDRIRFGTLYEVYGGLLTEKQQHCLRLYFYEDYSLAEIAADMQVSRQAIHDLLRRVEKLLAHYESLLGILSRREAQRQALREVDLLLEQGEVNAARERLRSL